MKLPALALILMLSACSLTPEGKQAKADAATINKNAVVAQKATQDAKDGNVSIRDDNASIQTHADKAKSLDDKIDAKDRVIEQYFRSHHSP